MSEDLSNAINTTKDTIDALAIQYIQDVFAASPTTTTTTTSTTTLTTTPSPQNLSQITTTLKSGLESTLSSLCTQLQSEIMMYFPHTGQDLYFIDHYYQGLLQVQPQEIQHWCVIHKYASISLLLVQMTSYLSDISIPTNTILQHQGQGDWVGQVKEIVGEILTAVSNHISEQIQDYFTAYLDATLHHFDETLFPVECQPMIPKQGNSARLNQHYNQLREQGLAIERFIGTYATRRKIATSATGDGSGGVAFGQTRYKKLFSALPISIPRLFPLPVSLKTNRTTSGNLMSDGHASREGAMQWWIARGGHGAFLPLLMANCYESPHIRATTLVSPRAHGSLLSVYDKLALVPQVARALEKILLGEGLDWNRAQDAGINSIAGHNDHGYSGSDEDNGFRMNPLSRLDPYQRFLTLLVTPDDEQWDQLLAQLGWNDEDLMLFQGEVMGAVFEEVMVGYERLLDVCLQLVFGIDYLHNTQGIAHLDIKPDNILFWEKCGGGDGERGGWQRQQQHRDRQQLQQRQGQNGPNVDPNQNIYDTMSDQSQPNPNPSPFSYQTSIKSQRSSIRKKELGAGGPEQQLQQQPQQQQSQRSQRPTTSKSNKNLASIAGRPNPQSFTTKPAFGSSNVNCSGVGGANGGVNNGVNNNSTRPNLAHTSTYTKIQKTLTDRYSSRNTTSKEDIMNGRFMTSSMGWNVEEHTTMGSDFDDSSDKSPTSPTPSPSSPNHPNFKTQHSVILSTLSAQSLVSSRPVSTSPNQAIVDPFSYRSAISSFNPSSLSSSSSTTTFPAPFDHHLQHQQSNHLNTSVSPQKTQITRKYPQLDTNTHYLVQFFDFGTCRLMDVASTSIIPSRQQSQFQDQQRYDDMIMEATATLPILKHNHHGFETQLGSYIDESCPSVLEVLQHDSGVVVEGEAGIGSQKAPPHLCTAQAFVNMVTKYDQYHSSLRFRTIDQDGNCGMGQFWDSGLLDGGSLSVGSSCSRGFGSHGSVGSGSVGQQPSQYSPWLFLDAIYLRQESTHTNPIPNLDLHLQYVPPSPESVVKERDEEERRGEFGTRGGSGTGLGRPLHQVETTHRVNWFNHVFSELVQANTKLIMERTMEGMMEGYQKELQQYQEWVAQQNQQEHNPHQQQEQFLPPQPSFTPQQLGEIAHHAHTYTKSILYVAIKPTTSFIIDKINTNHQNFTQFGPKPNWSSITISLPPELRPLLSPPLTQLIHFNRLSHIVGTVQYLPPELFAIRCGVVTRQVSLLPQSLTTQPHSSNTTTNNNNTTTTTSTSPTKPTITVSNPPTPAIIPSQPLLQTPSVSYQNPTYNQYAADIFELGVTFTILVLGKHPFVTMSGGVDHGKPNQIYTQLMSTYTTYCQSRSSRLGGITGAMEAIGGGDHFVKYFGRVGENGENGTTATNLDQNGLGSVDFDSILSQLFPLPLSLTQSTDGNEGNGGHVGQGSKKGSGSGGSGSGLMIDESTKQEMILYFIAARLCPILFPRLLQLLSQMVYPIPEYRIAARELLDLYPDLWQMEQHPHYHHYHPDDDDVQDDDDELYCDYDDEDHDEDEYYDDEMMRDYVNIQGVGNGMGE